MTQKRRIIVGAIFAFLLLYVMATHAAAQLPVTRLHSIFPAGAKAGTDVDVSITGTDLDEVALLQFSNPVITAKQKTDGEGKPIANQFIVNVPADVSPGTYSVRAVGFFGNSNSRMFDVADLPESIAPSGNHSITSATEIEMNTIVNGHADVRAIDHFKINIVKNQRVIVECRAERIDSMLDATLVLCDQTGRQIAFSRDANRRDPLLDFTATADATYIIKIYDFTYGGGTNHFYRLKVSDRPFIDCIFPPVVQSGTSASVTLYGRNLPEGKPSGMTIDGQVLEQLETQIDVPAGSDETINLPPDTFVHPREAFLDGFVYRHQSPAGPSNEKLMYFSNSPVITESEPNNAADQPQTIEVPCEFAGRFDGAGDRDFLRFSAKKDESFTMQLTSDRMGIPADPALLIQKIDDKGNASDIAFVEDDAANSGNFAYPIDSLDPIYTFKAPVDGQYQLVIRDHFTESQADPRSVYRLTIRQSKPDFRMIVCSAGEQHPTNANLIQIDSPLLRKNGMQILRVIANRSDGFNEPIQISAVGLPENVSAVPVSIPAGKNNADVLLTANDKVTDWSGTIQIVGNASIDGATVQRTARAATVYWDTPDRNNFPVYSRLAHDLSLTVKSTETAPVAIQIGDKQTFESAHDGKFELPVKLIHLETIKGDVQLGVAGLPGKHDPIKFEAKDKWSEKKYTIDIAKSQVPPGTHTFHFAGNAKISYRSNVPAADATAAVVAKLEEEIKQLEEAVKAKDVSAAEKLATAQAKLAPAEALAKQAADRAKPRDIDIRIRSLPITLTVAAPPAEKK